MAASEPPLSMSPFYGAALLIDFIPLPNGGNVRGITGRISVLPAADALGFKTGASESNWLAAIGGLTSSVIVPGCKIQSMLAFPEGTPVSNSDYWTVP